MKMSPEYVKAAKNMAPGIIASGGFLGNDTRLLVDIIEEDLKLVAKTGKSINEIVERMNFFTTEALKGLGNIITIDNKYEIKIIESRGFLPCPFKDGIFRKINTYIKNKIVNEEIMFSELTKHMILKHNFFQGIGSPYRLEPANMVKVLF